MKTILDQLDALDRAEKAATPGEWKIFKDDKYFTPSHIWSSEKHAYDENDEHYNSICEFSRTSEYGYGSDSHIEPDAQLIALMRNNIRALIDVARAAKMLLDNHEECHGSCYLCLEDGRGTHAEQLDSALAKLNRGSDENNS